MATVDDMGIYWCSSAEWGTWGIRRYLLVNVIGELTDKSSLCRTKKNCVNIEGMGECGLNFGEGAGTGNALDDPTMFRVSRKFPGL